MKEQIRIKKMWLNISTRCNNNCKSCYWHLQNNRIDFMDLKTMQNATIFYLKNVTSDIESFNIQFFGGEPLLNFEVIPRYVDWLKNNSFKINLSIFTNGILLNKSKIDYFLSNKITINISYDPNFEVFNSYKNLSFEKFVHINNMINYTLKHNPDSIVPYLIIKKEFIDKIKNSLLLLVKNGLKRISVARLAYENWDNDDIKKLLTILQSVKEISNSKIYVYPDMYFSCTDCYPYNIMTYPNGDIYDICYMCGSVLTQMNYIVKDELKAFYFGNLNTTNELLFDVTKKREIIKKDYLGINSFCPTLSPNLDDIRFLIE